MCILLPSDTQTSLDNRPKLVGVKKKLDRREATRERKALSAAKLEKSIAEELLERLKSKAYGDAPLNVNEDVWRAVLDRERAGQKGVEIEDEESEEEDEDDVELEEEDGWGDREFVSDMSGDEDEDGLSDLEDVLVCSIRVCHARLCSPKPIHRRRVHPTTKKRKTRATTTRAEKQNKIRSGNARHLQNYRNRQEKVQRRKRGVSR